MLRLLALCFTALFTTLAWAQAPLVVSTHPVYLIAKEITQGIEEPKLLLENQTGHDVHLTPAHRKLIQDAGLVIWLGKAHEAPLESILAKNSKAVALLNTGILQTLPLRNSRGDVVKGTVDTHVWLEPNNAVRIGFFIAALRSQQQPEFKDKYWSNAKLFAHEMLKTSQSVKLNHGVQPYWSLHDAYQYLERALLLKFAGAMTEDPHMAPTIAQIKYLKDHRPQQKMCLLAETVANKNQYKSLGHVYFLAVDESFAKHQNFITAWQTLAIQVRACVEKAQK